MTGLVARAEKRELVQRLPSPHDGRGVLVGLTLLGRQLTDGCAAEADRQIIALTSSFTATDHTRIPALTAKLLYAAQADGGAF
ncbi:hypothetical protein [Streptomyces sp. NPDC002088]|uniref:hypothetical protein n=1 Tax=Streptomyces sp. NPDC002088 TaxID=3154665 RepID=UPI0033240E90